jgi:type II secretory pathway component PulK
MVSNQKIRDGRNKGMVLYAVLAITAMSTMIAASVMFRMRAELSASGAYVRGDQAWSTAFSGIKHAMAILAQPPSEGGNYNNPDLYADQLVCGEGGQEWYFTIYAYNEQDDTEVRYGVTDTSGKINVNTASRKVLEALPNMTTELVDCLIDFRDPDEEPQKNGAEQEYYNQLAHPYAIRNGSLMTLEELLLIKGFDGTLVYGEDANFNTMLDPNEDDGEDTHPDDNSDGILDRGLRSLLTTISYARNVDNENQARININGKVDSRSLRRAVGRTTADFIEFYQDSGKKFTHPSQLLNMSYTSGKSGSSKTSQSGVNSATDLARVMDKLTVSSSKVVWGTVINVNTAPPEALLAVLGDDNADLVERIVSIRTDLTPDEKSTTAWLYGNDLVGAGKFKTIAPLLTARGFQYRIQVIGYGINSGRYCVLEAIVDLAATTPRILYLRDLTGLGIPFALVNVQEKIGN